MSPRTRPSHPTNEQTRLPGPARDHNDYKRPRPLPHWRLANVNFQRFVVWSHLDLTDTHAWPTPSGRPATDLVCPTVHYSTLPATRYYVGHGALPFKFRGIRPAPKSYTSHDVKVCLLCFPRVDHLRFRFRVVFLFLFPFPFFFASPCSPGLLCSCFIITSLWHGAGTALEWKGRPS